MKRLVQNAISSSSAYSGSAVWIAGIGLAIAVSDGYIGLGSGVVVFTLVTVLIVMLAMLREVRIVHRLVNSQRDELLNRISDLVDALHEAGVQVPRQRESARREDDVT